jgi:hypothetical protein
VDWRALWDLNRREHLEVYILASAANILLSLGQFFAIDSALGIRLGQQSTVAGLLGYDGSSSTLWMDFVRTGLIFQGIMAVLVAGVLVAAVSRARWKWPYALTAVVLSSYVAFVLGGKFLDMLEWVELDYSFGVPSYADLIVFGLGATACYFLMILVLNKSYGKLVEERTA